MKSESPGTARCALKGLADPLIDMIMIYTFLGAYGTGDTHL